MGIRVAVIKVVERVEGNDMGVGSVGCGKTEVVNR